MIEKSKVYPEFHYAPERYQIDHFHNPYLAKLTLKLTPKHYVQTYQLLSPLSLNNNMYISQSIPLYRDERFKLALIWKQYVTHKYARAHFGVSVEYKIYESLRVKSRGMVGTTSLLDMEISKQISESVEGFVGYSGLLESNSLFNSFSVGLRKGLLYAYLNNKMSNTTSLTLGASKEISNGLFLQSSFNATLNDINKGEIKLNLNQKIDNNSVASFGIAVSPYYQEGSLKLEYQRCLSKTQKVVFSTQYLQGNSIFYLGFKNLNFNFVFPVFAVEGPIPLIVGAIAFISSYIYKRTRKNNQLSDLINVEEKTEESRREELKLISEKAADSYEREKLNPRGILIEEAFIGPVEQIQEFMDNPNRIQLLLRNEQYRQKFVDLTVTLRFYVMKGELKIRKGQKDSLLGFYRKRNNHNKIGIRYIKEGKTKTVFFDYLDPIVITHQNQ